LNNLLSNAVKFTPNGGRVKLEVRMNALQQAVDFRITDTGIGIPPEHLDRIFQAFTQVDSSLSRQFEGTGLGLSIVQQIVELHHGSITVESKLGQGSCFQVTLPWQPLSSPKFSPLPEAPGSEALVSEAPGSEGTIPQAVLLEPKILLAEDNEANIMTMMSYLEAHNFQVILARNGLEAVQMAQQHQPDLILMDIQMPTMDGLEATRQIRAEATTCSIPIIALTALSMPADLDQCLAAGTNHCMTKPVKLRQLVEIITQYLSPTAPG